MLGPCIDHHPVEAVIGSSRRDTNNRERTAPPHLRRPQCRLSSPRLNIRGQCKLRLFTSRQTTIETCPCVRPPRHCHRSYSSIPLRTPANEAVLHESRAGLAMQWPPTGMQQEGLEVTSMAPDSEKIHFAMAPAKVTGVGTAQQASKGEEVTSRSECDMLLASPAGARQHKYTAWTKMNESVAGPFPAVPCLSCSGPGRTLC